MIPEHIDHKYVADHILRIEGRHANNPVAQEDSLYKIASNADLVSGQKLTDFERAETLKFIEQFKNSPEGKRAISYMKKYEESRISYMKKQQESRI
jgi:hypothetical protein